MRERIFTIVQKATPHDKVSKAYDYFITIVALLSVVPLMFKEQTPFLLDLDTITVYILFMDYIFRWVTNDYVSGEFSWKAFAKYPFTPFAIIDLLGLLPSIGLVGESFRILRVLRIVKVLHYSKSYIYISNVFRKQRKTLGSVLIIALAYLFISALVMFTHEPDTFNSFFDALYWATTALTTVGYGDVYPLSAIGRLISMISSLFGIAVIALPAGIVTGGIIEELNQEKKVEEQEVIDETNRYEVGPTKSQGLTKKHVTYVVVMFIGVLLNQGLYMAASHFNVPVWLDISGTAFVAFMLEPAAGLIVGLINNFYLSFFIYGSNTLLYYVSSAAVAVIVGAYIRRKGQLRLKWILSGLLLLLIITTLLSGTLTLLTYDGISNAPWEQYFFQAALGAGVPKALACYFATGVIKLFDIAATSVIVAGLYAVSPGFLKRGFLR